MRLQRPCAQAFFKLGLLLGFSLLLSACSTSSKQPGQPEAVVNLASPEGEWVLLALNDAEDAQSPPRPLFLTLKENNQEMSGRAAGDAGCNHFFSDYSYQQSELSFGVMGSNMMLCGEAQMKFERRYLHALHEVRAFELGKELILKSADGLIELRYGARTQ